MDNVRLEKIEAMLQVALDAICSLAKETTGKSMVIGSFPNDYISVAATPLSDSIKWVEE